MVAEVSGKGLAARPTDADRTTGNDIWAQVLERAQAGRLRSDDSGLKLLAGGRDQPLPDLQQTGSKAGGDTAAFTVEGGVWNGTVTANSTDGSPKLPEAVAKDSLAVANRLIGGESLKDIAIDTPNLLPEVVEGAFELLGVSNRQIAAYAEQAQSGNALGGSGDATTVGAGSRDMLVNALQARVAIDGSNANDISKAFEAENAPPASFAGALAVVDGVDSSGASSGVLSLLNGVGGGATVFAPSPEIYPSFQEVAEAAAQGRSLLATTEVTDTSVPVTTELPDGSTKRVKTLPDGGTLTGLSWPDGRTQTVEERVDGTVVTRATDPATGVTSAETVRPDGTSFAKVVNANDSTTTTTNTALDGERTVITTEPGKKTTVRTAADGAPLVTVVEDTTTGDRTQIEADGTRTVTKADGTTTVVEPTGAANDDAPQTLHGESGAAALQEAYDANGVENGARISPEMLSVLAEAASKGGVENFLGGLNEAQTESFTQASEIFAKDNGLKVAGDAAMKVFGTALSNDLGLEQSSAAVSNTWVELGRPGDVKFTSYYSVARQLYAEKHGEEAARKLDEPHYEQVKRQAPKGRTFTEEVLDLDWQYETLNATFKEAVADYKPTYDADGNLTVADPVTRVAQFAQTWKFSYGDGQTPTLTRPATNASDIEAKAAFANLGDTASRYDRFMDLGSANPGWINVLEGVFTLGIANLTQDAISQGRSKPINDFIADGLEDRGRDTFAADRAKENAIAKLVLDGAVTAVSVIDPLLRLPGALSGLTEAAATSSISGAALREQSLAVAASDSILGRTAPATLGEVEAGTEVTLSGGEGLPFEATSIAREGEANAIYAPVRNITGSRTEELVRIVPVDEARTQWSAIDEAGHMLGRVNVGADGSLDLSAGSRSMLGRFAGNVTLLRQAAVGASGLPGYAGRIAGDTLPANSVTQAAVMGEREAVSSVPWEAPALSRGFAASAVTDAGAAARAEVVDVLTDIGTGKPTSEQLGKLEAALGDYTDEQFGPDLDLTKTDVPNDFSQSDRAKMLDMLLATNPQAIRGMDESLIKFFGTLRPGEASVAPGFEAAQAATVDRIVADLSDGGLGLSQADFARLSAAEKNEWIKDAYASISESLGLEGDPKLELVDGLDPGTMANTSYIRHPRTNVIDTNLSRVEINTDGLFRGKRGFDDIGALVNVMTHELTHMRQIELTSAAETLSGPLRTQVNFVAAGDAYAQQAAREYLVDSANPNYRLTTHEAQAFDMGDAVGAAITAKFEAPSA